MDALILTFLVAWAGPLWAEPQTEPAEDAPLEEVTLAENPRLTALRAVGRYMDETRSLRATFVQRAPGGEEVRGQLSLARPGRVRFEYGDTAPILIVADGETLHLIDTEIGQVTKWPVQDTPLRVLLGESVNLAAYGAQIDLNPGGIEDLVALIASDPDRPEMGQVTLYFTCQQSCDALALRSWSVVDAQGGLTMVELEAVETNVALADELWTFEDPRGLARRRRRR